MPNEATALQRAQMLAALSVGGEIIHLRRSAHRFGVSANLCAVLVPLANGHSTQAIASLSRLDKVLTAGCVGEVGTRDPQGMRGRILIVSEALTKHADYFDIGPIR